MQSQDAGSCASGAEQPRSEDSVTLPAEWHPQDAVLLTWPHAHGDWQPYLPQVEPVYVEIARAVCARQRLIVCAHDSAHVSLIRTQLDAGKVDPDRVAIHVVQSNDSWTRDHGPITVYRNGRPCLLDFRFNGWGGKYPAELDDRISASLHAAGAFGSTAREAIDFVLEGGAIESDGAGTLLTTSRCLLSAGRNPRFSREDITQSLCRWLGLQRVLWLEHGYLEGDDTDSHIDTLARFCDERTIAYVRCNDQNDPHHAELAAMERELQQFRDADSKPYQLVPLPWPQPKRASDGRRLPATYANFLIINGAVLAPVYGDAADALALQQLAACFPRREIIAINCLPLIQQFGSLHCITMQLPAGTLGAV